MTSFKALSRELYGEPDKEVFEDLISILKKRYRYLTVSDDPELRLLSTSFLASLPPVKEEATYFPDTETLQSAYRVLRTRFSSLINLVPLESTTLFKAAEIKNTFEKGLAALGYRDWSVIITHTSKSGINTDNNNKRIIIPAKREVSASILLELLVHEVGCHVVRQMNGEATGLKLFGLGLAHYDLIEEGLATFSSEGLFLNFEDFSGAERYLSIALTLGLDGIPRNFREVFIILEKYYQLEGALKMGGHENLSDIFAHAKERTWVALVRTFRGTDCITRGVAFTKDIIYRDGNIAAWKLFNEQPEQLDSFYRGKYHPQNKEHQEILRGLEILP
jgi:Domain of unknown function (DUF1704)